VVTSLAGIRLFGLTLALGCHRPPALDTRGRAMLDPLREQMLQPSALIRELDLPPEAVVADIGAGPGFLTLPLARALPRGRVIATDIEPKYLEILQTRARRAGLHNVETRVVRPEAPGLAPSSVDLALLCQVDHALADRARYFAALLPALKPGGRIALVNYQRYRAADLAAAHVVDLECVHEWTPSPPFFGMLLMRTP
jgi:predicted O-methyltransferase YrrM